MNQLGKKIIEVVLVSDLSEEVSLHALQCVLNRDNLSVVENSLTEDLSQLKGKEAVIILSSKHSLYVEGEYAEPQEAVQEFLPGASSEEYFIQKSLVLPSVYEFIHKNDLKNVLESLLDVTCTQVILESMALKSAQAAVKETVEGINYTCNTDNRIVLREKEALLKSYTLDDRQLSISELLGLGAVLAKESGSYEEWNEPSELTLARKTAKETNILKLLGLSAVAVMLVLSLGNFFLFTSYTDELNQLNQTIYGSNISLTKLEDLKAQAAIQDELRSSLNTIASTQGAFLVDKICAQVPTQIRLTKYVLEAPDKIKSKKKILFNDGVIIIKGNTISTIALNQWMQGIEAFSEINSVKLISYEDSREKKGDFEIGITLGDV